MSKKVSIQWFNHHMTISEPAIMLSDAVVRKAKIPDKISLHFGSIKHTVRVVPVSRLEGLRINQALADRTGLAAGEQVRMKYKPASQTLTVGPLIGVLVPRTSSAQPGRVFGNTTAFCQELTEACHIHGASAIFFTPEDAAQHDGRINAWVYRGGSWRKQSFPLPNVVYNRLTTRKVENSTAIQKFMQDVKSRGGKVFNERFLNKTEVFQALRGEASLHRYLPESHSLKDFAMLKAMCQKYSTVFLKPIRGSLGKGIIRIVRTSSGGYSCQHAAVNGTKAQIFPTLAKLYTSISGKIKQQQYQVQQGLQLLTVGNRPMDFRALVQKDETGHWKITSIVARIAGSQHFVSNIARGGTMSKVREALLKSNLPGSKVQSVYASLRNAALRIAEGIDKQIPEHFGELGIDLAVSSGGNVWLLEVNSKPSKNDDTQLSENKIRPSVKQIVLYSRYLANM